MNVKLLYYFLPALMGCLGLRAQDPFALSFQSNRALINPSFVGIHGVESIQMNAKMQWNNPGDVSDRYQTLSVLIEEPLPCTRLLDMSLSCTVYNQNQSARIRL